MGKPTTSQDIQCLACDRLTRLRSDGSPAYLSRGSLKPATNEAATHPSAPATSKTNVTTQAITTGQPSSAHGSESRNVSRISAEVAPRQRPTLVTTKPMRHTKLNMGHTDVVRARAFSPHGESGGSLAASAIH